MQYKEEVIGKAQRGSHLFIYLFIYCLFRAMPMAYGGSQARGQIGAIADSLRQNHSHVRPEPRLRPAPQLTATPDP